METKTLDYIIGWSVLTALISLSILTTLIFSLDNRYHIITDLLLYLFSFGAYSVILLRAYQSINPYPCGEFAMNSNEFMYWKMYSVFINLADKALTVFNTVFTQHLILSAFGANIGKNAAIAGVIRDHPLITLHDFATIGEASIITGHVLIHNTIILKPVVIGRNAVVGINCVIMPGVTLGEGAVVAPGSVVKIGTDIPAYELWGGIPARKIKDIR